MRIRDNRSTKTSDLQLRPNADSGLWLAFILPLAIIVSAIQHPSEASELYKLCAVLAFGLSLSAFVFVERYWRTKRFVGVKVACLVPGITIAVVYYIYFRKGFIFSCWSGSITLSLFHKLYFFVIKHFPQCFTLGEAFIVVQGVILFSFSVIVNVVQSIDKPPVTTSQISTLVIQVGLVSVGLLCLLPYKYPSLRKTLPFYSLLCFVVIFILLVPLLVLLRRSPLLWILDVLFSDVDTLKIVTYWCVCCCLAVIAIHKQVKGARKASTAVRKTFHVLAVAVFLPGLIYNCSLIYLASGIVFGIFAVLELLRILNLPPLGGFLQNGFFVFSDEKDAGSVAFTPFYLLVGCSVPLWIHPAPCDLTDSAGFNLLPLLGGLLSVGIGDTAASFVGSSIGRYRWSGTKKTFEGTLAYILSQACMIYALMLLGFIDQSRSKIERLIAAVVGTAVVEAKTNQIDNLVLPLIMYVALI